VLLVIFRIGGAAVDTPEIAAVGHRNSQIGDPSAEFVLKSHVEYRPKSNPKSKKPDSRLESGARRKVTFPV
jgi:hypothetical protein